MAKGGKNKGNDGPADNTRKGSKKGDNECNEVSSGQGLDNTASQSNTPGQASDQDNTGTSPGTTSSDK